MKIRTKITLTFFILVVVVLTMVSFAIYFSSAAYRHSDFTRRLKNRAINTSKLLIEIDEVSPQLLRRIEKENPANLPDQYVVVYNYKNEILYSSQDTEIIPVDTALINKIRLENEVIFNYKDYEAIGFMFIDKFDRFTTIAAAKDIHGFDALANLRNILVVIFAISVVIISILGWIYAGKVIKPISKIVSKVDSITEASLNLRLDEGNRSDELAKLSQTFNRMLERIQLSFVAQKNFISNASHELRTPIAIISAEVDAALLQSRSSEEYVEVLKSVHENIKGLNALSTQLLLLAQATANLPDRALKEVRIDEILWEAKHDLQKIHSNYKVNIHFDLKLNDEALNLQGDPLLLKAVFTNLIDNGCKYSNNNEVIVNLTLFEKSLKIEFANNGRGIEPGDMERIFAPFYRGKNTKSIKGYGIGLPLSIRIVKLHEGKLEVESIPYSITKFILTLPLSHRAAA